MVARPIEVTIRAYQVGFGDCFLLTFRYRRAEDRHVLIDCGSTASPPKATRLIERVAESIREECGGKLHVVVATHRHKDHISGFATRESGDGPGDILRGCNPNVVIQPWTEDPEAQPDARSATPSGTVDPLIKSLSNMHLVASSLLGELSRLRSLVEPTDVEDDDRVVTPVAAARRPVSKKLIERLSFMGDNNLPNRSAIENLQRMGERHLYVHFGSRLGLSKELPGVKVSVLGPPTLEQSETILKQRHRDQEEFWHLQAQASQLAAGASGSPFLGAEVYAMEDRPRPSRWLIHRLRSIRGDQLREIVRILDKALNNTSVILLIEIGEHRLLFPGDAQLENWLYALEGDERSSELREVLSKVTFYKVGHHGSLNATPKSLWNGFVRRSDDKAMPGRLRTIVSTMGGKHGDRNRGTEVPRETLIHALSHESAFATTQDVSAGKKSSLFLREVIDLTVPPPDAQ